MFATLRNAWRVDETKKRITFTLLMLIVIRMGNALPVPFVNMEMIGAIADTVAGSVLGLLNLVSGGGLASMSVFALGVGPHITASIVIQLLTFAIPALEELSKEGEEGRKKIQRITKFVGVILAFLQAFALVQGIFAQAFALGGGLEKMIAILAMVAGSQFLMWLGDLITERGVGNGVSFIIFVGIVASIPGVVYQRIMAMLAGLLNPLVFLAVIIAVIFITVIVVLLSEGERKIPVQYAKRVVGRKMYGGQATHIPIKVNMSGVLPVIFAMALLSLPNTLALLFGGGLADFVAKWLTPSGWSGFLIQSVLKVGLIILFAYFYNSIQFNAGEYAKNLQQAGGFIPGIRPGRPTTDYLNRVVQRVTFIGAVILAFLSIVPELLSMIFNVPITIGGTSVIIVVGVVLEMIRTLEAQLQLRHYKGFLNR